jgi:TolB-like protein
VLVLPFTAASDGNAWIGRAVQQDLLADLTQGANARVLAPSDIPSAADPQAALKIGHDRGASIVVFGQAQSTPKETRLTGAVLDVATEKPLAGLKATGPSDELFHLEDALAGQVFAALPKTLLKPEALARMQQAAAAPAPQTDQTPSQTNVYTPPVQTEVPVYTSPSPEVYSTYPDNYYATPAYGYYPAYTYPYADWSPWPFWGFGVFIGGRDHDHDDFHHGDFHHGDFHHGDFRGGDFRGGDVHRGFASGSAGFNRGGGANFSRGGIARQGFGTSSMPRMSSGGIRGGGGFHSAVGGGARGFSGGGFHGGGGGGGFHGGGGAHGGGGGGHR